MLLTKTRDGCHPWTKAEGEWEEESKKQKRLPQEVGMVGGQVVGAQAEGT